MSEPVSSTESNQEAFERGENAGRVEETLKSHAESLAKIYDSIGDSAAAQAAVAEELRKLSRCVQSLEDAQAHDREMAAGAVSTLREVDEARREAWTPQQRILGTIATVAIGAALFTAAKGGRW